MQPNENYILQNLPKYNGIEVINFANGSNNNIIETIHNNFKKAVEQTKTIATAFKGLTVLQTCKNIADYLVQNIKYVNDGNQVQKIKLPSALLNTKFGDCKSFSLFTGSILYNLNIPFTFRYVSYNSTDQTPTHVYIIAYDNKQPIIIDAVYQLVGAPFNSEKKYYFKKDYNMKISSISGFDSKIGCACNDNIGSAMIGGPGVGKFGDGLKKAAQKVQQTAKKTATKAQTVIKKDIKQVQQTAKKTASKAQTAIKKDIKKTAEGAKKVIRVAKQATGAGPREAFKALILLNYRGWANILNNNLEAALNRWFQLGGQKEVLKNAIQKGMQKKPLAAGEKQKLKLKEIKPGVYSATDVNINGVMIGGIGSVEAILAAAATIVAAFSAIINKGGQSSGSGSDQSEGGGDDSNAGDLLDTVSKVLKAGTDIFSGGGSGAGTDQPQNDQPQPDDSGKGDDKKEGGFFSKPLNIVLLLAGGYFGGKALKIIK